MVSPSAWASHILVSSKSEAIQIKSKVTKLKDFQKLARKKAHAHQAKKAATSGGFAKVKWCESLMMQCGQYRLQAHLTLSKPNLDIT